MKTILVTILLTLATLVSAKTLPSMVLLTDLAGVHDQSFNQNTWDSVQLLQKNHLVGKVSYEEPVNKAQMLSDLYQASTAYKWDYIVVSGFDWWQAVAYIAKQYPQQKIITIDVPSSQSNVEGIVFNRITSGQQAGQAIVHFFEKKYGDHWIDLIEGHKPLISFIGGPKSPITQHAYTGLRDDMQKNDNILIDEPTYMPNFTDVAYAKEWAKMKFNNGIDVVFCYNGPAQVGVIDQANESTSKSKPIYVIGADRDMSKYGPKTVIASIVEKPYLYMVQAVKNFQGHTIEAKTSIVYNKKLLK